MGLIEQKIHHVYKIPLYRESDLNRLRWLGGLTTILGVILRSGGLPPEFDLHRYVDYEMQFNKAYLDPKRLILDVIGWSVEKKQTLEEFFT